MKGDVTVRAAIVATGATYVSAHMHHHEELMRHAEAEAQRQVIDVLLQPERLRKALVDIAYAGRGIRSAGPMAGLQEAALYRAIQDARTELDKIVAELATHITITREVEK